MPPTPPQTLLYLGLLRLFLSLGPKSQRFSTCLHLGRALSKFPGINGSNKALGAGGGGTGKGSEGGSGERVMNSTAADGPVTLAHWRHLHLQILSKAAPPERERLAPGKGTPAFKTKGRRVALRSAWPPGRHSQAPGRARA